MTTATGLPVPDGGLRLLHRIYGVPVLRRLGGPVPMGGRVLEIGCGTGYSTKLILDNFAAFQVDAVDADAAALVVARRRLAGYGGRVRLAIGPVADPGTATGAPPAFYDAVFDLAAIPSGMDWRAAVGEIARLLRPGGRFYFTEVTAGAGDRAACRPTAGEFLDELARRGLDVAGRREVWLDGGYLLGVADRTG